MYLLIDNSNTNTKWALADKDTIHWQSRGSIPTSELLASGFPADRLSSPVDAIVYCSVVTTGAERIESLATKLNCTASALTANSPHGLALDHYPAPETIGTDRLANAIASLKHSPGKTIITIDSGTATTIDAISPGPPPRFLGGLIAPGQSLLAHALHSSTNKLPLVNITPHSSFPIIATSTHDAIGGAITHGYPGMITSLINLFQTALANDHHSQPAIILTGGNASTLAPHLPSAITIPDLPLHGLHTLANSIFPNLNQS